MFKINKKIIAILLIPFVIYGLRTIYLNKQVTTVKAFGDLKVDFGIPANDPIFTVNNMLPGDCEKREIIVSNDGDDIAVIAIRSDNEIDNDLLSEVLTIDITNTDSLYFDTLKQFFIDSDFVDGVFLENLNPDQEETYTINICLDESADNNYQNTSVIFDLIFGEIITETQLPAECRHLEGVITTQILGTENADHLYGTHLSELIIGLGGADHIDGGGGDDCIVGGDGNDHLYGEAGRDVIVGGNGNDNIFGGSNHDLIFGNEGNDNIDGGSGRDTIYGSAGNDRIRGGSGADFLYGNEGNDNIFGNSGGDFLDGGPDSDFLKGNSGNDECINGETVHNSCEIF